MGQGALELQGTGRGGQESQRLQEAGREVGEVAPGLGTSVRLGTAGSWPPGI